MQFQDEKDVSANQATLDIYEGQWESLYLRIHGTAAVAHAKEDVGVILGYVGGIPFLNIDLAHLVDFGNRLFGTMLITEGVTYDYAFLIPCGVPDRSGYIPNTMLVNRDDKAHLTIPNLNTTTATATLYAIGSLAPSNYLLEITERTETLGGTCIVKPGRNNVQFVGAWDAATTDPDTVAIEYNGRERIGPSWTDGENYGNMVSRVETAVAGHLWDLNPARVVGAMRNYDVKVKVNGGAGAQTWMFVSAIFTPQRAYESGLRVQDELRDVIREQQRIGADISAPRGIVSRTSPTAQRTILSGPGTRRRIL